MYFGMYFCGLLSTYKFSLQKGKKPFSDKVEDEINHSSTYLDHTLHLLSFMVLVMSWPYSASSFWLIALLLTP